jgi:hypothetical protein
VSRPLIIEEGTTNSEHYINEILSVVLEGVDFIFPQDNVPTHREKMTQQQSEELLFDFGRKIVGLRLVPIAAD